MRCGDRYHALTGDEPPPERAKSAAELEAILAEVRAHYASETP